MLVFNLASIPVGLVIGLAWWLTTLAFPALEMSEHAWLVGGVYTLAIGTLSEVLGIKGRIFFLPIWLIGLGITAYGLWGNYSWIGLLGAVLLLGGTLALVFGLGSVRERQSFAKAQAMLHRARAAEAERDMNGMREALIAALFVPWAIPLTSDVAAHSLNVLALFMNHFESGLAPADVERVRSLWTTLELAMHSTQNGDDVMVDFELVEQVRDIMTMNAILATAG